MPANVTIYGTVGVLFVNTLNHKSNGTLNHFFYSCMYALSLLSIVQKLVSCLKNRVPADSRHIWGSGGIRDGVLFVNTLNGIGSVECRIVSLACAYESIIRP